MRTLVGCSLIVFLAACSGSATPHNFSSDGDNSGDGTGDGSGDGSGDGTGDGTGSDDGGTGGGSTVVPPASTQLSSAADVAQVNFYQATEVVVVKDGKANTHTTPVIAGRPALVRVFVSPHSGSTNVTAQLRFEDGTGKAIDQLTKTQTIASASTETSTSSTINFDVPAKDLIEGGKFSVALVDSSAAETADGTVSTARFPQDGSLGATGAKNTGVLKVMLVPVVVSGGFAPDTSTSQIQTLHDVMFGLYPVTDVQITVHAQTSYNGTVSATNSQGFENVLEWGTSLRQSENAPDDVYYWITFDPKSTFASFCGSGCIAGLSSVAGANDPEDRVSTGIGYTGSDTAFTMAHEIGHAHGRNHAPGCGASGIDSSFPSSYVTSSSANGSFGDIGVLGYDIVGKTFQQVATTGDVMGYCPPTWVSDYTYSAFATRVSTVNAATSIIGSPFKFPTPQAHRFVNIDADGNVRWGQAIQMRDKPQAGDKTVSYLDASGNVMMTASAKLHEFSDVGGGYLIVPEGPAGFASIKVSNIGATHLERTLVRDY